MRRSTTQNLRTDSPVHPFRLNPIMRVVNVEITIFPAQIGIQKALQTLRVHAIEPEPNFAVAPLIVKRLEVARKNAVRVPLIHFDHDGAIGAVDDEIEVFGQRPVNRSKKRVPSLAASVELHAHFHRALIVADEHQFEVLAHVPNVVAAYPAAFSVLPNVQHRVLNGFGIQDKIIASPVSQKPHGIPGQNSHHSTSVSTT